MLAGFTSVNDSGLVSVIERLGDLAQDLQNVARIQARLVRKHLLERCTGNVFHDDEHVVAVVAELMHRYDAGMRQVARRARFPHQALPQLRALLRARAGLHADHLDCDRTPNARIVRVVNDAHRPAPQLAQYLIVADGLRRHVWTSRTLWLIRARRGR